MLKFGVLNVPKSELRLGNVLQVGQAFRWTYDEDSDEYISTLKIDGKYNVVILKDSDTGFKFASLNNTISLERLKDFLTQYFRISVNVESLYNDHWLKNDPKFELHPPFGGRILAQEPWETLISFICSSNNNISRITKMCHSLSTEFGNKLGHTHKIHCYSFPSSDELVLKANEDRLRQLGFGYRSKYIIDTAKLMLEDKQKAGYDDDTEFLNYLGSKLSYEELREQLMRYSGVGPKVADCVCLMGFKMDSVVPVDVHVQRIAKRDYRFQVNKKQYKGVLEQFSHLPITRKKINPELDLIRLMFVEKWGQYAGWAQGMLFSKEVSKTSGATSSGGIKRGKLELDAEIKIEEQTTAIKKFKTVKSEIRTKIKEESLIENHEIIIKAEFESKK